MATAKYVAVAQEDGGPPALEKKSSMSKNIPWAILALALLGGAYFLSVQPDTVSENIEMESQVSEVPEASPAARGVMSVSSPGVISSSDYTGVDLKSELDATRRSLFDAQRLADERAFELNNLRKSYDDAQKKISDLDMQVITAKNEASSALMAASKIPPATSCPEPAPCPVAEGFDIDAYRETRLAATPPNIIECAEAEEGKSQETCHLPRNQRYQALSQKGITLWMTGLSGSGKSTIARALEEKLVLEYGLHVQNLDGDNVRTGLNRDLGFSPGDRAESVRRVGEMACLFTGGGVITLVTLVSPYQADRDAARKRHEEQGLKFMEVLMDVPLEVVQQRDPKGLYEKALKGELKGMTGMSADAPYEPPPNAEVVLPNYKMTIEESVFELIQVLKKAGVLEGGPTHPLGLPMPVGIKSNEIFLEDELIASPARRHALHTEALTLPKALVGDIEVNWLQVISEGWAAPLRGFLREGPLMQVLHFNSLMTDTWNRTGAVDLNTLPTNWNDYKTRGVERVPLSIPITLPATDYTKAAIEASGKKAVALVDKDGQILGVLRNPEIYAHRKEEIAMRCFGAIDMGHPYIQHIYESGPWLIGGEIELVERIRYNDGLDQWRLTPKELYHEFEERNADVVYAFQTRNPTHAGHAYLMKTGLEKMREQGFQRPLLLLSPLGGWTKEDDVPLDVRVKQHQAIIEEGMLDKETTVLAIWPAPMIYAGPTEVQFHASSRRNAGCAFFVVGRDAAGMKGSSEAVWSPDDDLYKGEHARYVLQMSPVLEDHEMGLISFDKFYYDKADHTMKAMDESRPDDFISISGSKMRALARQGATPCTDPIPSDLLAANCVPQGFMAQKGWDIVCDYYQNVDSGNFIPWSKAVVHSTAAVSTEVAGQFGTLDYKLYFKDSATNRIISPWHDIPLSSSPGEVNFVVEIPMYQTAKMEVNKGMADNPITQDSKKNLPRYYKYGVPFFNYGLIPQTWEDPSSCKENVCGDDDPLDAIEIGSKPQPMGSVVRAKVLGALELIDEGETDYKIIIISLDDPDARRITDMTSLEAVKPGTLSKLVDWLSKYKTAEGKGLNTLANNAKPYSISESQTIIEECYARWLALVNGETANTKGHYITMAPVSAALSTTAVPAAENHFDDCMNKCEVSLRALVDLQKACIASCVSKYGRR